jgi:ParB-like chromosome segregation protein Spo0J
VAASGLPPRLVARRVCGQLRRLRRGLLCGLFMKGSIMHLATSPIAPASQATAATNQLPVRWSALPAAGAKPGWPSAVHPAATLFPSLQGVELGELAADIQVHGLREPIVVHQGLLIDGRNRLRACELAGVEPRFVDWHGAGSVVGYILSVNLHRRHLDESQRAMAAARSKPMFQEEAAQRRAAGLLRDRPGSRSFEGAGIKNPHVFTVGANLQSPRGRANAEAGQALNVSERSVTAASKVLARADEEIIQAVESGMVAVSDAAAVATLSPEKQRQAIERVKSGRARTLRQAIRRGGAPAAVEDAGADLTPEQRVLLKDYHFLDRGFIRSVRQLRDLERLLGRPDEVFGKMTAMLNQIRVTWHAVATKHIGRAPEPTAPLAK